MIEAHQIETMVKEAFPQAQVIVTDMAGDGRHYALEVVDASFEGKNRVQQHQMVYAALQGKMDGKDGALHALALTTKLP